MTTSSREETLRHVVQEACDAANALEPDLSAEYVTTVMADPRVADAMLEIQAWALYRLVRDMRNRTLNKARKTMEET